MDSGKDYRDSVIKWVILLAILFGGVVLLYAAELSVIAAYHMLPKIVAEFGIALIAASVLGMTIDGWLKRQIIQDVFRAAFGYSLSRELITEIRELYVQSVVISEFDMEATLDPVPENSAAIRITIKLRRVFSNRTSDSITHRLTCGIDEFFFEGAEGRILSYSYFTSDKRVSGGFPDIGIERHENGSKIIEPEPIILAKDQSCTVNVSFCEIRRKNDDFWFMPNHLVMAPEARIVNNVPGLKAVILFHNREKNKGAEVAANTYKLNSHLLPFQTIHVRFWEHEKSERWLS